MRYVVGYTANKRGIDAINLASTLGKSEGALIEVVVVLPVESRTYDRYTPDRSYYAHLEEAAREWLDKAMQQIPAGVNAAGRIYHADSIAEGLIRAATDPARGEEAALIALGASHRGALGRMTAGSVADALLHSSPVPVALAPAGYKRHPSISRVTAALGSRRGAAALLEVAVDTVLQRNIPLRLMSLVALDVDNKKEREAVAGRAMNHAHQLKAQARERLQDAWTIESNIGTGRTVEECVRGLEFKPDEIVLVGSSRLARRRRLFLGSAASKMLRALPVPMVVVPRNYEAPVGDDAYDRRASSAADLADVQRDRI